MLFFSFGVLSSMCFYSSAQMLKCVTCEPPRLVDAVAAQVTPLQVQIPSTFRVPVYSSRAKARALQWLLGMNLESGVGNRLKSFEGATRSVIMFWYVERRSHAYDVFALGGETTMNRVCPGLWA